MLKQDEQGRASRIPALVFAGFTFLGVGAAQAEVGYIGLGGGSTNATFDKKSAEENSGPDISADESDSGWRVFGGYQINENLSIEGAYVNLGKVTAKAPTFNDTYKTEVTGVELSVVGFNQVSKDFSMYLRGGVIDWKSDWKVCLGGLGCDSGTASGADLVLGIGGKYNFTKHVGLRAEYTLYDLDETKTGGRVSGSGSSKVGAGSFKLLTLSGVIDF